MRYAVLSASMVIQICLGGLYAWSSLVPQLQASYGHSMAQMQLIFGVMIATFTIAMVFAGRLAARRGPRVVAGIGGVLFGGGYLLASVSGGSYPLLLLGVGVIAGAGTGFGYVCPLGTCMKWFPRHKGLVTGLAVAGFGAGAVVMSLLVETLLAGGMGVLSVIGSIGLAYGIVIVGAATVLRSPACARATRSAAAPRAGSLLRDPFFVALVVGIFSGTFAGLMVVGNLKPLALSSGVSLFQATAAISIFAAGNAAGRVTWGWLADRLGRRAVGLSLVVLALSLGLLGVTMVIPLLLFPVTFLVGFGFGSCFIVYAAQVAARYGPDGVTDVYPLVFLAYGAAGIAGPLVGGWLYDLTGGYSSALLLSFAVVVAGMAASLSLLRRAEEPGRASSEHYGRLLEMPE